MSSATPHRIDPPITLVHRTSGTAGGPHKRPSESNSQSGLQSDPTQTVDEKNQACFEPHRVDAPHAATHANRNDTGLDQSTVSEALPTPHDWLRFHASELVDRLQAWASDLDSREAQLNARTSLQDHRERQFRLQQQDMATELAEQQRSIERLRGEIEAQARRLAFQQDPSSQ